MPFSVSRTSTAPAPILETVMSPTAERNLSSGPICGSPYSQSLVRCPKWMISIGGFLKSGASDILSVAKARVRLAQPGRQIRMFSKTQARTNRFIGVVPPLIQRKYPLSTESHEHTRRPDCCERRQLPGDLDHPRCCCRREQRESQPRGYPRTCGSDGSSEKVGTASSKDAALGGSLKGGTTALSRLETASTSG